MRLRHELVHSGSPDQVYAMLADPEYRRLVGEAMDVVNADITITPNKSGMTVVVDQEQRTDDLPSFARTFAGSTTRAIQKETWTSATKATLEIDAPGKPTSMKGTISLTPKGASTVQLIELDVKVSVPLIGGKLEKFLGSQVTAGYDVEQGVATQWLKEHA